jgi:hypothetical protein
MKKAIKIAIAIVVPLAILVISYLLLLQNGCIGYSLQINFDRILYRSYSMLRLDKLLGPLHLELNINYPTRLYSCDTYYLRLPRHHPNAPILREVLSKGLVYNSDLNLLFATGTASFLKELVKLNNLRLMREEGFEANSNSTPAADRIKRIILYRYGNALEKGASAISLNLYDNGEAVFGYRWNGPSHDEPVKWGLNSISIRISWHKNQVIELLNEFGYSDFFGLSTIDTDALEFASDASFVVMAVKKENKCKVIFLRVSKSDFRNPQIKEFWKRVVSVLELKKELEKAIFGSPKTSIGEWNAKYIRRWLSSFGV